MLKLGEVVYTRKKMKDPSVISPWMVESFQDPADGEVRAPKVVAVNMQKKSYRVAN